MWWKYIGFAGIFVVLVLVIRPDLLWGPKTEPLEESTEKLNAEEDASRSARKKNEDYTDPRRPTLLAKDKDALKNKDGVSMYAEGYSEKDFGDAYREPEEMFKISENSGRQSAGGLWDILLELTFDISYDQAIDDVAMRPLFTKEIKNYDGKTIEIEGYIIPYDIVHDAVGQRGDGTMFMLSAFPAATCFFCKGAGPESVMEVYPKKPIPYSKKVVKIKGRLELNDSDYMKMAYILQDARLVE